jgi:V/A-type H+-transporting ATPase subunit K
MATAGILGGIALGVSAWLQGRAGAACADALAETNQGFGNYLMTIGIIETVALFVLVFSLGTLK